MLRNFKLMLRVHNLDSSAQNFLTALNSTDQILLKVHKRRCPVGTLLTYLSEQQKAILTLM